MNRYIGLVVRAATQDQLVCRALVEVTNLLAPPSALFAPRVVLGTIRTALRRPRREKALLPVAGGVAGD
jgi:hypothetical protein